MGHLVRASGIGVIMLLVWGCSDGERMSPPAAAALTGPYLGQTAPAEVPELFAPGYLPDIGYEHTAIMFTKDGGEGFWGRVINPQQSPRVHVIMRARQERGVWLEPELAPFNVGLNSFIDSVSPDGKRVFFQARERTAADGKISGRWTNWVAERTPDGWGQPRLLEAEFSWDEKFFDYQVTRNGNRYFTSTMEGTGRNIGLFRSALVDGTYDEPRPLGPTVNSEHLDYGFYVDHDERFVLFTSDRPAPFPGTGIYVSFRQPDQTWGEALSVDKVNLFFDGGTAWPYLSPDGRYLFFLAAVDAYRDSDVEQGTYEGLKAIAQSPENGYSRIYWVDAHVIYELESGA